MREARRLRLGAPPAFQSGMRNQKPDRIRHVPARFRKTCGPMLLTEQSNQETQNIDQRSTVGILKSINREDARVAAAVGQQLESIARVIDAVVLRLEDNGRLFYVGTGASGRLGLLDAVECPPTFGTHPSLVQAILAGGPRAALRSVEGAEDDRQQGARDLARAGVTSLDAVVGITASGGTAYTVGAIQQAAQLGAFTASISCNENSEISGLVDAAIEVVCGPEVVTGSTRLKAGTAQKMVLNMISTATMIRLGNVYSNLMVNLNLSNRKLIKRGIRIVAEAAKTSLAEAEKALKEAGDVRSAIIMISLQCTADEARGLVSQSARLNEILKEGKRRRARHPQSFQEGDQIEIPR